MIILLTVWIMTDWIASVMKMSVLCLVVVRKVRERSEIQKKKKVYIYIKIHG